MSYFAAVVPTMNEQETIGALVKALDKFSDVVIVSDDSSRDARGAMCRDAAAWAGASVVQIGGGLGRAYQAAWAICPDEWYVGHIDAGGSHDPLDLLDMYDLASTMDYDVVLGDRFGIGGEHHGKWSRRVTSRLASWALNLISLADYDDWTSGLRVYSPRARAVLEGHKFTTTGHAWQIESLWVLREAGMKIAEYPIVYQPSVSHLSASRVREAGSLWWRLLWA